MPHSMWKFLGQRLNPSHSSDPRCWSDKARSLTRWATRKLQGLTFHIWPFFDLSVSGHGSSCDWFSHVYISFRILNF